MQTHTHAAQAVREAYNTAAIDCEIYGDSDRRLAAAFRAAADVLVAYKHWDRYPALFFRRRMLALADDLERRP